MISDIQPNATAFAAALDKVLDETEADVEKVVRKTIIDLWDRIRIRTPFRIGRARNGWGIALGEYPPDDEPGIDESGSFKLGKTAWIYNNVVYIERLEDGWSKQAPQGMVALSLAEYASFFRQAAAQMGLEVSS